MVNKATLNTHMNDAAGKWIGRMQSSIPRAYTVAYDNIDGLFRAECNNLRENGDDYESTDSTNALTVIQNAIDKCSKGHLDR